MLKLLSHLILFIFAFVFSKPVIAADIFELGELYFETVGDESDIPWGSVMEIEQDKDGFLWIGTQDGLLRFDGYRFRQFKYSIDDPNSISGDLITALSPAQDGRLWVGTSTDGVSVYNPKNEKFTRYRYSSDDPYSLVDNKVHSLLSDQDGGVWVGTNSGLDYLAPDSDQFQHFKQIAHSSISDNRRNIIHSLMRDQNGILWVGSEDGISLFDIKEKSFIQHLGDSDSSGFLTNNTITQLFQASDGKVWVGTKGQGAAWIGKEGKLVRVNSSSLQQKYQGYDIIYSIAQPRESEIWLGTYGGGISIVDASDGTILRQLSHDVTMPGSLNSNNIAVLKVDASGLLWIGTWGGGLNRYNPNNSAFRSLRHNPTKTRTLSSADVSSLLELSNGNIWVGFRSNGIDVIDPAKGVIDSFRAEYEKPGGLADIAIKSLAQTHDGTIWVGTVKAGLHRFLPGTRSFRRYVASTGGQGEEHLDRKARGEKFLSEGPLGNDITTMLVDDKNNLWIGTSKGLNRIKPNSENVKKLISNDSELVDSDLNNALSEEKISHSNASDSNLKKTNSEKALPDQLTFETFTAVEKPDELFQKRVRSLAMQNDGTLWVGTDWGLYALPAGEKQLIRFTHQPGGTESLNHDSVSGLLVDDQNRLWIDTALGLNLLSGELDSQKGQQKGQYTAKFESINRRLQLADGQVFANMLQDPQGRIWSDEGMLNLTSWQFRSFDRFDDIDIGGNWDNSFIKTSGGTLMFGGSKGVLLVKPELFRDWSYQPPLVISELIIDGMRQPVAGLDELVLGPEVKSFSIEFSTLDYSGPANNQYAYQLYGYDSSWNDADSEHRQASYTNLDPGTYVLHIKGSNRLGDWSDNRLALPIRVVPAWYQTVWLKFLVALFILSIFYLIYKKRVQRLKKRKQYLEEQVQLRTAELNQQKQALQDSYDNVSVLSEIGKQINATLDFEEVLLTVHEYVNQLMDATIFGVGVYEPEKKLIRYELAIENGQRYKPYTRSTLNREQFPVWCIENKKVVFINDLDVDGEKYLKNHEYYNYDDNAVILEGGGRSSKPGSFIYIPMLLVNKVVGIISVQSLKKNAYQPIHVDILQTLASYAATALENARTHRRLIDAQKHLVESEKMASLGGLVAGVAHEINTPLGICITTATHFKHEIEELFRRQKRGELTKKKFQEFEEDAHTSINLILKGLLKTRELIKNFKGIDVAQSMEVCHEFNLGQLITESLGTLSSILEEKKIQLKLEYPENINVFSYPGIIKQIIMNLSLNSIYHGFGELGGGVISIKLVTVEEENIRFKKEDSLHQPSKIRIIHSDNGKGMSEEQMEKVFEPFFTTKRGGGHTGLGLNIVYNQVTQMLGGSIECNRSASGGFEVEICIPVDLNSNVGDPI
ncbi:two-component regulator propeller domain-containing protein [Aliikangiella coralliicola]|uniref:histidine kinase n=1 Tax=Aliikangiella coralliicola TaxID=2592383 RepID=A0A545UCE6_9GAMM|nr:two-component regulator propeller domain-containing protein [Aliikangiella coralliicola]TQV87130.1 hypothetical protein FLL46_15100 [Aliikangiella coralliicola]